MAQILNTKCTDGFSYNLPNFKQVKKIFLLIFFLILYLKAGAFCCNHSQFTSKSNTSIPDCTSLQWPLNNATDVAIDSFIFWNVSPTATGYFVNIGTTSGGTNIANMFDVGNSTFFSLRINFDMNTTFYVSIIPYNSKGNSIGCLQESFTTGIKLNIPFCTQLRFPVNGEVDVRVNLESIGWDINRYIGVGGHYVTIGTTPGGTDILNNVDVGNGTGYHLTSVLPYDTQIYVTIIPLGSGGKAVGCSEESFRTETNKYLINIPEFFTPNSDGYNDFWIVPDPKEVIKHIAIFDRYGKLLKSIKDFNFVWDGNVDNKPLQSSDYWYVVELINGKIVKGHFSLKR